MEAVEPRFAEDGIEPVERGDMEGGGVGVGGDGEGVGGEEKGAVLGSAIGKVDYVRDKLGSGGDVVTAQESVVNEIAVATRVN